MDTQDNESPCLWQSANQRIRHGSPGPESGMLRPKMRAFTWCEYLHLMGQHLTSCRRPQAIESSTTDGRRRTARCGRRLFLATDQFLHQSWLTPRNTERQAAFALKLRTSLAGKRSVSSQRILFNPKKEISCVPVLNFDFSIF